MTACVMPAFAEALSPEAPSRYQRALHSQGYSDRGASDWQRELALDTFDTMGEDDVKFYTDEEGFPYYG